MRQLWLGLGFATLLVSPRPAEACTYPSNPAFEAGDALEATPPSMVEVGSVVGQSSDVDTGGCNDNAARPCGSSALISIGVAATDDVTPVSDLGYRIRIVSGDPPPFDAGALYDRKRHDDGVLLLTHDEEAFDFELGISAVDGSGNVGPEATVRIAGGPPEHETGACAAARIHPWSLLWVPLAFALRRRYWMRRT
jgi:hypothetical protein